MKFANTIILGFILTPFFLGGSARAQSTPQVATDPEVLSCAPAPCVLPPLQASHGVDLVNTPSVTVDPLNPRHMVLGTSDFNCVFSSSYTSGDGGSGWSGPFCLPYITQDGDRFNPGADPVAAYDRKGVAYLAAPYFHALGNGVIGFIGVESSNDGVNWSEPVQALRVFNSFAGYTWLVVDTNPGSPYVNNLYVSAVVIGPPGDQSENAVVVAHSADSGTSWHERAVAGIQISPQVDSYTNMAIGKDGTVYLSWMYCDVGPYFCNDHKGHMVFSKSSDGGNSWSKPVLVTTVDLGNEGPPNTHVGADNYPAIAVDNSNGPYAGSLYMVMYHWTGTYMRVQVVRSSDGGQTWSKPVPVARGFTHDQFFPWLSVSPTGLVGVSWLDRRNDPANVKYQAFAAISRDGGQSFQPNVQLTTAFSDPDVNGYPGGGWMGDHTGNTWAGPNNFIAAWMDSSNGVDMQVMVGGIRLK